MQVERASLFLVDRVQGSLLLQASSDDQTYVESGLRIPLGSGIAGAVAASGDPVRVDDAYRDPRFNPDIDKKTSFTTRSILCLPLRDRGGEVFAVAQLLNPEHGGAFTDADVDRFQSFTESLGVILETWKELAVWSQQLSRLNLAEGEC